MREKIPKNLTFVWHRGSKSFAEILINNKKVVVWEEAPLGEQLPESVFQTVFQTALGLAQQRPEDKIQFTRYDNENLVDENENNRPFRDGAMEKVIIYLGYVFKTKI